jgi:hypothetical protein
MKLALALFVLLATCFGLRYALKRCNRREARNLTVFASLADQGTVYIKDGEYIYVPGILDTEKGGMCS